MGSFVWYPREQVSRKMKPHPKTFHKTWAIGSSLPTSRINILSPYSVLGAMAIPYIEAKGFPSLLRAKHSSSNPVRVTESVLNIPCSNHYVASLSSLSSY